jgi:hypothetical protein
VVLRAWRARVHVHTTAIASHRGKATALHSRCDTAQADTAHIIITPRQHKSQQPHTYPPSQPTARLLYINTAAAPAASLPSHAGITAPVSQAGGLGTRTMSARPHPGARGREVVDAKSKRIVHWFIHSSIYLCAEYAAAALTAAVNAAASQCHVGCGCRDLQKPNRPHWPCCCCCAGPS